MLGYTMFCSNLVSPQRFHLYIVYIQYHSICFWQHEECRKNFVINKDTNCEINKASNIHDKIDLTYRWSKNLNIYDSLAKEMIAFTWVSFEISLLILRKTSSYISSICSMFRPTRSRFPSILVIRFLDIKRMRYLKDVSLVMY